MSGASRPPPLPRRWSSGMHRPCRGHQTGQVREAPSRFLVVSFEHVVSWSRESLPTCASRMCRMEEWDARRIKNARRETSNVRLQSLENRADPWGSTRAPPLSRLQCPVYRSSDYLRSISPWLYPTVPYPVLLLCEFL